MLWAMPAMPAANVPRQVIPSVDLRFGHHCQLYAAARWQSDRDECRKADGKRISVTGRARMADKRGPKGYDVSRLIKTAH